MTVTALQILPILLLSIQILCHLIVMILLLPPLQILWPLIIIMILLLLILQNLKLTKFEKLI